MSKKSRKAEPERDRLLGTMEIPYPVAWPEDRVLVLNYRCKPARWEEGTVHSFSFVPAHTRTSRDGSGKYEVAHNWNFDVWVIRPTKKDWHGYQLSGGDYRIVVGPESIRPIKEES